MPHFIARLTRSAPARTLRPRPPDQQGQALNHSVGLRRGLLPPSFRVILELHLIPRPEAMGDTLPDQIEDPYDRLFHAGGGRSERRSPLRTSAI
jgi:hypothetical protein